MICLASLASTSAAASAIRASLTPHPWLLVVALACSVGPALLFLANLRLYQPPAPAAGPRLRPISVLIPARNEEGSIAACVQSVLASGHGGDAALEVIVLDDASTDRTAAIVQSLAAQHPQLRSVPAPPLPAGWNGKQHACHILAGLARYNTLCFLDADVRLEPDALARLAHFMTTSPVRPSLVSGFPLQQTGTLLEWLLIPLIHFVLLCYLPIARMRAQATHPALAAGCGQLMIVDRAAYLATGGHAAIRQTMHDGLLLPRLFRHHGFSTDLADLTPLARCRMYTTAGEVWQGLGKNATEGLAAPARIVPFTVLLGAGQVLPLWLAVRWPGAWTLLALGASYLPRLVAARRFHQSWRGALLHPFSVILLLVLEWYALGRKLLGGRATWKERAYDVG